MRAPESVLFGPITATTAAFQLVGGAYMFMAVSANWNGGSVGLNLLGPDGVTWLSVVTAQTANGGGSLTLPPGQYKFSVSGTLTAYAEVVRIPGE